LFGFQIFQRVGFLRPGKGTVDRKGGLSRPVGWGRFYEDDPKPVTCVIVIFGYMVNFLFQFVKNVSAKWPKPEMKPD
jgi:hypothetical protein